MYQHHLFKRHQAAVLQLLAGRILFLFLSLFLRLSCSKKDHSSPEPTAIFLTCRGAVAEVYEPSAGFVGAWGYAGEGALTGNGRYCFVTISDCIKNYFAS